MSLLPLATVLVLHARPIPTFSRAAGISPATGMGEAIFLSSERWGTLGDQGENDQIALSLTALPAASPGKTYYAWLLSDAGTSPETALLLGRLLPRQGKATLLYQGDSLHSNLLARFSRLLITEESANPPPLLPSPDQSSWFATSAFAPGVLASLRSLLSRDQALQSVGLEGGLLSWLLRNTQALLSRASSARDHATGRNSCLIHRQLVRILDFLDGTSMVRQDVSPGTPLLSDPQRGQVGLLQRDPLQRSPALLYLIGLQDQSLLVSPGLTHAQWIAGLHIMSLLNQVNQSFEEVRTLAHQLVRMTPDQLMQPLGLSLLDQLVNAASIAYAGQAPVGTASLQGGVLQIVAQVQQLATLALDACRESGAATKAPLLSVPLHCSPQGNLRLN